MPNITAEMAGIEVKKENILEVVPAAPFFKTGDYIVTLKSWKTDYGKFGKYVKLAFEAVEEGECKGKEITVISTAVIKKSENAKYTSKLYSIVSLLLDRELQEFEKVDLDGLIGKKCKILLNQKSPGQYPEVIAFLKATDPSPLDPPKESEVKKGQSPFEDKDSKESA